MAKKRMLINVSEDETRIALTENDVLVDLHVEQVLRGRTAGNIYRGTVVKVNPAFQAAFVEYGDKKNGFLSINDLNPTYFQGHSGPHGRPRIQSILRRGQNLMVQVLKEGVGAKGAALTTNVALPGRYLVLNPYSERSGVSRKIEESENRTRLKEFLTGLSAEGLGVIVRTAGIDRTLTELKRDFTALRRAWKDVQDTYKRASSPGLIYREPDSVVRVLRDYFSEQVEEVWVDSPEIFQTALEYFKSAMPKFQKRLKLYIGDRSLFSLYKIEEKIEALDSAKVPLPSGGSIVIAPTEALVTVDVNSGKSNQESDIEETALRTNLEAADEVARQLRLRNLGGLIVIDFIDMSHKANQNKVVAAVGNALKHDKARTTLGTISQFGLLELSRQRIDMELSRGLRIPCDNCGGTGHVPTMQASANTVLRKLREIAAQGGVAEIHGSLPLEHANFLLNHKREYLSELELEFGIKVHLMGDPQMPAGQPVRLAATPFEPVTVEEGEGAEELPPEREVRAERPRRERRPEREREREREPRAAEEARPAAEETAEGDSDIRKRRRRRRRRPAREEGAGAEPMAAEGMAAASSGQEETIVEELSGETFTEARPAVHAAEWDDEGVWAMEAGEVMEDEEAELDEEDVALLNGELEEEEETLEELEEGEGEAETAEEQPAAFHEPAADSAISLSHTLPTAFALGRRRRPDPAMGSRVAAGEAIFQSTHREGERPEQEHETALIPMVRRDDPFQSRADASEAGDVFFESTHRDDGEGPDGNGGEAGGSKPAKDDAPRRRRTRARRPRRSGQDSGAAERPAAGASARGNAATRDTGTDDDEDSVGNRITDEPVQPGPIPRPSPTRSRRGGTRRRRPPAVAS